MKIQQLKAELYEMKKLKVWKWCAVAAILLAIFITIVLYASRQFITTGTLLYAGMQSQDQASFTSNIVGMRYACGCFCAGDLLSVIVAVYASYAVGYEFEHRTYLYAMVAGTKRKELYTSKLMAILLYGMAIVLIYVVVANVLSVALWGIGVGEKISLKTIFVSFAMECFLYCAFMATVVGISYWVQKMSSAMIINIVIAFATTFIEKVMESLGRGQLFSKLFLGNWILTYSNLQLDHSRIIFTVIIGSAYIIIFTILGYRCFMKYEWK